MVYLCVYELKKAHHCDALLSCLKIFLLFLSLICYLVNSAILSRGMLPVINMTMRSSPSSITSNTAS